MPGRTDDFDWRSVTAGARTGCNLGASRSALDHASPQPLERSRSRPTRSRLRPQHRRLRRRALNSVGPAAGATRPETAAHGPALNIGASKLGIGEGNVLIFNQTSWQIVAELLLSCWRNLKPLRPSYHERPKADRTRPRPDDAGVDERPGGTCSCPAGTCSTRGGPTHTARTRRTSRRLRTD